jgi:methenyltetrahydromethanopterin cyclohydrolase
VLKLNETAIRIAHDVVGQADRWNVEVTVLPGGTTLVDCGVEATGGVGAGCKMAEICLAGLGSVHFGPGDTSIWRGPWVTVTTDRPLAACLASQYAGWPLSYEDYFAMGSGPMRAARGREPLFEKIGCQEEASRVVGVLESARLPTDEICQDLARQCRVEAEQVTLVIAPTASLAGTLQIVARSVETALHKLLELGFDMQRIVAGTGTAPMPPVAADDLSGIGRTNDAVLYGGRVMIWVRGDDASLSEIGPQVPSSASADAGRPFREIFERYDRDFYRIDPLLFSPAEISFVNIETGRLHQFGAPSVDVLRQSFAGTETK